MHKAINNVSLFLLLLIGLSSNASATLILEQYDSNTATPEVIGGYDMTDFAVINSGQSTQDYGNLTISSIDSPLSGTLFFEDRYGNSADLTKRLANSETWWDNGESSDYDVFSTKLHLITIVLPENTRAFSFNVGAHLGSTGNNAWMTAAESAGLGIDDKYNFNVNSTNTPGFGIYVSNDGSCSALTSVTIDPTLWGFGNFSINQDPCTTSVPAPASITLLAIGLLGLGAMRKKASK